MAPITITISYLALQSLRGPLAVRDHLQSLNLDVSQNFRCEKDDQNAQWVYTGYAVDQVGNDKVRSVDSCTQSAR